MKLFLAAPIIGKCSPGQNTDWVHDRSLKNVPGTVDSLEERQESFNDQNEILSGCVARRNPAEETVLEFRETAFFAGELVDEFQHDCPQADNPK